MGDDSSIMGTPSQGPTPVLVSVRAPLGAIRSALVGVGAVGQDHRSVALDLGEDLLVLAYDDAEHLTTVAVGGNDPLMTARWLAEQLEDLGWQVEEVGALADHQGTAI
jgi:hypothetical protein